MPHPNPDHSKSQKLLQQRETVFRLLVESVSDYAIIVLDPRGRVASWNPGAERVKGYTESEIVGQHFSRFYPSGVPRAQIDAELETALERGVFRDEGWRIKKDGTAFWADVTLTPIRDAEGELLGFAKVTRDASSRKQADAERVQLAAERAVRERLEALIEVSRGLAEAGLEFPRIATVVARQIAERIGDACVIRLIRGTVIEPVAVYHPDEEIRRSLTETLTADTLEADTAVNRAVRTKAPVMARGSDLSAQTAAHQPHYRALVDRLQPSSMLVVPMLLPGGDVVGVISLARFGAHRPPYSAEDQLFVEALAFRSALSFSNSLLYAQAQEAHEQLKLIFQSLAEGVIVQGPDGRILVANDAGARMCGFATGPELMAAPIAEVLARFEIHDEAGEPFPLDQLPARRALRGEDHAEAIFRTRSNGSPAVRWSVSKARPLRNADGKVLYAVSVFDDITDRRRLLERLRFLSDAGDVLGQSLAYEETLAAVAQLAVPRVADWCAIDVLDEQGGVRRLAAAHVDPEKVAWARQLQEQFPVDLNEPNGIGAVLRTGQSELRAEVSDEHLRSAIKDPEHLRILQGLGLRSYVCVPLLARDRAIGALTLLTTDESGRLYDEQDLTMAELLGRRAGLAVENARLYAATQAALEQLTEISRTKDEFLATLSHELRTPLNAIVGWAQLLQSGALDADMAPRAIQTIRRNADLQTQLIADILDVSRIITGKVRLNVQAVSPASIIEQTLDTVRPTAAAKNIALEAVVDPSVSVIAADPERLQQVMWNLLSNAIKFAPSGGHVQVRLNKLDSAIEIVVQDDGPGIHPDFLPHVFERFRQADSSSTRSHKGLGLGLAIVRHLVDLHGGDIRAENLPNRAGAVFTVRLPNESARTVAVEKLRKQAGAMSDWDTGQPLAGIRLMIVDDDEEACDLLGLALEKSGADVLKAPSAESALAQLAAHRPDVLLADIEMPERDGYWLLRELRKRPAPAGGLTPAIAVTAYASSEERIRALAAGFDLHLTKPIQMSGLLTAVARLAGRRR